MQGNKKNTRLRRFWRAYYKPTYRIVAFLLATLLMVLCFPSAGRFNYDYELMRPWRHENLIAPYDVPILKTEEEIRAEKDSLMKGFLPYYQIDTTELATVRQTTIAKLKPIKKKLVSYVPHDISVDSIFPLLSSTIADEVYGALRRGVIDVSDKDNMGNISEGWLMLINGNVVEQRRFVTLLTPREAYEEVANKTVSRLRDVYGPDSRWLRKLVEKVLDSELLIPNIHYDDIRTSIAEEERLENVSRYSGKIQRGEMIVNKGDIVNEETVRHLESLKHYSESRGSWGDREGLLFVGLFFMIGSLMLTLYLFMYYFRKDYFRKLHYTNLVLLLMCFLVCVTGLLSERGANISYIVPYAVLPIMLRIFADSRFAMYVNTITILIISLFAYNSQLFIILHIPAGLVACVALFHLNKRIQIFRATLYLFVYYIVIYISYQLWQKGVFTYDAWEVSQFAISSVLLLLAYPLIYVVEKTFGFISDVTLLELADVNNKLLRDLSEKAPGTFQHSLQVANLGQEVAYKLGGNAMLVRAGALYHDVGKVINPMFFTENQISGVNPHEGLTSEQSSQVIINHVREGLRLARKHNLPQQIQDIIESHHGTSMVRYFYISWCNEHPTEDPDLSLFTYQGFPPKTKEQAIIMMADAVEASSKSITDHSDDAIDNLVEKIIDGQMSAGQFNQAPLTFADIEEAKKIFKLKLRGIYHARIQYPEMRVGQQEATDQETTNETN